MLKTIGPQFKLATFRVLRRFKPANAAIDVLNEIAQAQNILVCPPENDSGLAALAKSFHLLNDIFPNAGKKVILRTGLQLSENLKSAFELIEYGEGDFNAFGLLNKFLHNKILAESADVVLDLNKDFSQTATIISLISKAPVRVCFDHEQRNDLYNFIVKLTANHDWQKAFQIMFQYLCAASESVNNRAIS